MLKHQKKAGVSRGTGYIWQKIWNNSNTENFNVLFDVGNFGGPKPNLSYDDLKILKDLISHNMSVKDVKKINKG
ncbi:hypothetical protein [Methanobrevibacter arboriphilus]|uniref:hypothetical protein n=1 Tax=Methanobrevibacter arboriphilus TaxID=39441 RepID=UPI001CDB3FA8|nr:hypothetical protein [Methanobrevibacter arboriphilus]